MQSVTNTLILQYPTTVGITDDCALAYVIDLADLDPDPCPPIHLNGTVSELVNVFSLFGNDREVLFDGSSSSITITSGKQVASFALSNPKLIKEPYNAEPKRVLVYDKLPSCFDIPITKDDINKLKQAASVFTSATHILLSASEDKGIATLVDDNRYSRNKDYYMLNIEHAVTYKTAKVYVSCELFFALPLADYVFSTKVIESTGVFCLVASSKDIPSFKAVLTCE